MQSSDEMERSPKIEELDEEDEEQIEIVHAKMFERETIGTHRIQQMERENFNLRKRCTRLESIVAQLLSSKGQHENEGVKSGSSSPVSSDHRKSPDVYRTEYSGSSPNEHPTYHSSRRSCDSERCHQESCLPKHKTSPKHGDLSPGEMELRNEFFRSTYYHESLEGQPSNNGLRSPCYRSFKYSRNHHHHHHHHIGRVSPTPYERPTYISTRPHHHYTSYAPEKLSPPAIPSAMRKSVRHHYTPLPPPPAAGEMDKYNSDFFTKLPPKLHIVESQNKNGVTLTWNATSNADSSLVKTYQLFARELFGHKVGTMKRMGVVDALPLPMSCTIANLKAKIKYKFAVCAVDVYGRFGKMSNFTGKFELKTENDELHEDSNNGELKIIL